MRTLQPSTVAWSRGSRRAWWGVLLLFLTAGLLSCSADEGFNPANPFRAEFHLTNALRCLGDPLVCGDVCRMTRQQIVDPANWHHVQAYMQQTAAQGSTRSASATTVPTTMTEDDHFAGTVLLENGTILTPPKQSNIVQVLHPPADTLSSFPIQPVGASIPYLEGVLAFNGKVYLMPFDRAFAAVVDPANETGTEIAVPGGGSKWLGGVLAPNGKVFGIPNSADLVLVIDPADDTVTTFATPVTGASKWATGVLAPNGLIYAVPRNQSQVLVIDPNTHALTTFDSGIAGPEYYFSAALAPNGKIYAVPRKAPEILVIDPSTNTTYRIALPPTTLSGPDKWQGAVLGPDGKIYGIPQDADEVLVIDPTNDTVSSFAAPAAGNINKWRTGVLHDNGFIYASQFKQDSVLKIDPGAAGSFCRNFLLSAYMN